jgi:hypothetical protein
MSGTRVKVAHVECDAGVAGRVAIELLVVRRVVRDLLAAGYQLSVAYDTEGAPEIPYTKDAAAVVKALFACDDEWLLIQRDGDTDSKPLHWVRFVYGNDGWDVAADWSHEKALAPVMDPIGKWTDELGDGKLLPQYVLMHEELVVALRHALQQLHELHLKDEERHEPLVWTALRAEAVLAKVEAA